MNNNKKTESVVCGLISAIVILIYQLVVFCLFVSCQQNYHFKEVFMKMNGNEDVSVQGCPEQIK